MLYVFPLMLEEIKTLQTLRRNHSVASNRRRADAILLNHHGKSVQEIATKYNLEQHIVVSWIRNWENDGIAGLLDKHLRHNVNTHNIKKNVYLSKLALA